jgi:PAT family beta-lactamase induction signal transducer AmpG
LYGAAIITAITRYGLLTLIAAIAMSWCNPRVAATQFTLYLAFTNLGMAIAATLVGSLDKWGGFFASFAAYGLIALVALVVAFFLKGYNN